MDLIDLIERIPATIWSAVIASLLAFGGVLLSNWISLRALTVRIRHEAEEAERKRKSDIRKEVYLSAAEELVKANIALNSIVGQPQSKDGTEDGLLGLNVAAAKLQMLMEQESALLVGNLLAAYGKLYIETLSKLGPIRSLRDSIEFKSKWLERIQAEISRILSLQVAHNESGNPDPGNMDRLQRSFESQQGLAIQVNLERAEMWKMLLPLHRELSLSILAKISDLQPMGIQLLIAMRLDFEVESDTEVFLANAQKNMHEIMSQLGRTLEEVDRHLNSLKQN